MAKRKRKRTGKVSVESLSLHEVQRLLQKKQQMVAKLEQRKQALMRQLQTVESRIAEIAGRSVGAAGRRLAPARRGRPRKASGAVTLRVLLNQILAQAGKPMKVGELTDEALRCGYKTTSKQFRLLVRQTLNRMDQVKRVGRGQYALATSRTAAGKKTAKKRSAKKRKK